MLIPMLNFLEDEKAAMLAQLAAQGSRHLRGAEFGEAPYPTFDNIVFDSIVAAMLRDLKGARGRRRDDLIKWALATAWYEGHIEGRLHDERHDF